MGASNQPIDDLLNREYAAGFITDVEVDSVPPGLSEDIIRTISARKQEPDFLLEWRLKAYRHWRTMPVPQWSSVHYPPINYQDIVYYAAPKSRKDGPSSLDEVDPKILETYEKLGIPLEEQEALAGVAVDAVFDSVSVATTYKDKLAEYGIIFCSFSEAAQEHPELVQQYLGSVVPHTDNFFAIEDVCTHDGGTLAEGDVEGYEIECPRHGARFDLRTGKVTAPPAYEDVTPFATRIHAGMVQVRDERPG